MRILLSVILSFILLSPTVFARTLYTYEEVENDLTRLAKSNPEIVQLKVIGHTVYHRNIYAIAVGHGAPCVVITASHHGREWITTSVVMKMITSYCRAYRNHQWISGYPVRPILDSTTIWFVPMVNPDGVTLQQFGPRKFPRSMYRTFVQWNKGKRDFTEWKSNAQGIDLNLQYDGDWGKIVGAAKRPASKDYKGKAPYQASEVKALRQFLVKVNPQFEVAYHASGSVIFSNQDPDPRSPLAKDLSVLTGYRIVPSHDSYGGLTDWWTRRMKRPGVTIEVGPFYGERPVPPKYVGKLFRENQAVGLYLAARCLLTNALRKMGF